MEYKHFVRRLRRKFGYAGLRICSLIARFARENNIYLFANTMGKIGYILAARQRKIALDSLQIAFTGEKSQEEIKVIAKNCFLYMAKSGLEIFYYIEHPEKLPRKVFFEGRDNLDKALAKGKGVIAVSAHFGNFPLQQFFLAQQGYQVNSLIRHMRDPAADSYFLKKREKLGLKTVYTEPRRQCVYESLRSLKKNEILFAMMDQNFGTSGVFVDFFGAKAATAVGPVVLALRSKAAILPTFIIRNTDDTHRVVFEPQIDIEERNNHDEAILVNVQKITNIFQRYIIRYPSEWGWIHKRWKTRPTQ